MPYIRPFGCIVLVLSCLAGCTTNTATQAVTTDSISKSEAQVPSLTPYSEPLAPKLTHKTQVEAPRPSATKLATVNTLNTTVANANKGKMTPEQMAHCRSLGGKVTKAGMAQFDFCSVTFADAGSTCQDGSQCQSGSCLAPRRGGVIGQPNQSGICSPTNSKFGCRQTLKNGVATPRICID